MVTPRGVGSLKRNLFVCTAIVLGPASAPATAQNGQDAELRRCVADALHGRSILGSRDTVGYIQYRSKLESLGVTEYDAMVGHCRLKSTGGRQTSRSGPPREPPSAAVSDPWSSDHNRVISLDCAD